MKRRDYRSQMPPREERPVAWTPRVEMQGITGAARPPRIVVGVDGSAASIDALRWAARRAELTGGTVESVISWQLPLYGAEFGAAEVDWAGTAREALGLAVSQALNAGCCVITRVVRGPPVDVLLQAAAGADLLVVGTRRLGALLRILSQSVRKRVVAHATCPVVVIHHRRPKPAGRPRAPTASPIRVDDDSLRRVDPGPGSCMALRARARNPRPARTGIHRPPTVRRASPDPPTGTYLCAPVPAAARTTANHTPAQHGPHRHSAGCPRQRQRTATAGQCPLSAVLRTRRSGTGIRSAHRQRPDMTSGALCPVGQRVIGSTRPIGSRRGSPGNVDSQMVFAAMDPTAASTFAAFGQRQEGGNQYFQTIENPVVPTRRYTFARSHAELSRRLR
ncbi:Nucleotide-binding universal stress protein, UspA family [Nakamurella panacisegetis]|uniref:Nucleotide-binding universal stress protein, UspA family n=1 Tax=Nakamurella panacisegetis TaxID=1090615 RepID=A0A1H0RK00_9ACTN|nr:Nucleotide-binding universal stress protein, UspA family [Nakamurella panacisegetis]